jgi:hypothetical protein
MDRTYRVLDDAVEVIAVIVATAAVGDADLAPCPIAVAHVVGCPARFSFCVLFDANPEIRLHSRYLSVHVYLPQYHS